MTVVRVRLENKDIKKIPFNFSITPEEAQYIHTEKHKHIWKNDTLWVFTAEEEPIYTEQKIVIHYQCTPDDGLIFSNTRHGKRTVFADNWPNRAQHWIPVVDHPTEKASCSFEIIAPAHYNIVSNGEMLMETKKHGLVKSSWLTQYELPTKVMVFGAADFAISKPVVVDGVPVTSWIFEDDSTAGFTDYAIASEVLKYYGRILNPYPFEKLANVQSKTRYGGMENASCIFYSEKSVTGKKQAERLIAHEIAHQWYGNTASEADWYHLWLSEGFATYLTELYIQDRYGDEIMQKYMEKHRSTVIKFARKTPDSPVIDTTVKDLNKLLNPNNYEKGAWFLHMLEYRVGRETFLKIINDYYEQYKFKNALTRDFQEIVEKHTGEDLDNFFQQWLYRPGVPQLTFKWSYKKSKGLLKIKVAQKQPSDYYELKIPIRLRTSQGERVHDLFITQKSQRFTIDTKDLIRLEIDPEVKVLAEFLE